jgi:hypothetical protein
MKEDPVPAWFRKGIITSQNTPHRQAVNLMFQIDEARNSGDNELVKDLSLKAAKLEEQELEQTPLSLPRTRAIYGNSAVALYFKAGDFASVIRLGNALVGDTNPVLIPYHRNNILEMLEIVNRLRHPPTQ